MHLDELNPKAGDRIRLISDHAMKGVEVEVPDVDRVNMKVGFGAWISLKNMDGRLWFDERGWCWGCPNKWELVEK